MKFLISLKLFTFTFTLMEFLISMKSFISERITFDVKFNYLMNFQFSIDYFHFCWKWLYFCFKCFHFGALNLCLWVKFWVFLFSNRFFMFFMIFFRFFITSFQVISIVALNFVFAMYFWLISLLFYLALIRQKKVNFISLKLNF